jgi:hypothetical protein
LDDPSVLDDGLPPLAAALAPGEDFPVACWPGPRFGAVLRVQLAGHLAAEPEDQYDSEAQVFLRTA